MNQSSVKNLIFRQPMPTLAGTIAPFWFIAMLLVFGALRPDFSHLTKAVSELGAVGAPNALAWNVLGFGVVGALVSIFAWGLWNQTDSWMAALLVAISGFGFIATGVFPADMDDLKGTVTQLHILASYISFAAFNAAVFVVGWVLWRRPECRFFATIAVAFGVVAILSVLLRETAMPPGLAQRINFLAYLFWIFAIALGTWRSSSKLSPTQTVNDMQG